MMNEQLAIEAQDRPMEVAINKMPKSSVNFEPGCTRAFLEHCLRLVWKRKVREISYLKYLLISKRFLNTSQQFPIFVLMTLFYFEKMCLGILRVEVFDIPLNNSAHMQCHPTAFLTYRRFYKLLSLLRPNHFYIIMQSPPQPTMTGKKCSKLLSLVHGKIGLMELDRVAARSSHSILSHLDARKFDLLCCPSEMLTNPRLNSPVKAKSCLIYTYINSAQLASILCHKIEFLSLKLDDEFIDETNMSEMSFRNSLASRVYNSLTKLHVECDDRSESFIQLLDFVKDRCSNLKEVILQIEWSSHKWSSGVFAMVHKTDSIVARFLEIQCKIQEIMAKCKAPISKLQIDSTAGILYYRASEEFNCNWIEDVKKLDFFKDVTHQNLDTEKICRLNVKLNDGFLDLRIVSEIHFGPQKSSQLSD